MDIEWQGGMQFDGKTVIFDRAVTARGEHQSLKTQSLEVSLRRRVDFANPRLPEDQEFRPTSNRASRDASEIEQVICRGGVTIQNKSFDEEGQQVSIDHMQMRDIAINQVNGAIEGRGPGWITTVRRGGALAPGSLLPTGGARSNADTQPESPKFSFLNVRFEGPIGGNVHRRELTFSEQVRSVYGPVDDWQSELDPDTSEELGPQAVLLNCDQLTVRQMGASPESGKPMAELEAVGNTLIEGQTFTARAHRMTFTEAKDLLVLEGNGSVDAQIFYQARPGEPTSHTGIGRMKYWRSRNEVEIENARFLDVGNLPAGKPRTSNGGFPNLFPKKDDGPKNPLGPDAHRPPRGNGTALPSIKR
jgi:hypothetical protein